MLGCVLYLKVRPFPARVRDDSTLKYGCGTERSGFSVGGGKKIPYYHGSGSIRPALLSHPVPRSSESVVQWVNGASCYAHSVGSVFLFALKQKCERSLIK